ncbi:MAG: enoyl-CoA hydratase-related protein, partial [Gammaproteobacteria bacterium]
MSEPYADFRSLKFDRPAERVLRIRLDNPGKLNAVDARMHKELADIWRVIDTDSETSAVILTGAGDAFSAGGDFEMLESLTRDQDTRLTVWKEARDIVYNVINCSKPVISAIRGPAVGAGLAAA